jgi:uncharacterized protein YjbJ (UPF0337 family)
VNSDIFEGRWKEIRGRLKEKWGDLTDDDLTQIDGHRDRMSGWLQKQYGYSREQAEHELEDYLVNLDSPAHRDRY